MDEEGQCGMVRWVSNGQGGIPFTDPKTGIEAEVNMKLFIALFRIQVRPEVGTVVYSLGAKPCKNCYALEGKEPKYCGVNKRSTVIRVRY